jgi:hypothetical protein
MGKVESAKKQVTPIANWITNNLGLRHYSFVTRMANQRFNNSPPDAIPINTGIKGYILPPEHEAIQGIVR